MSKALILILTTVLTINFGIGVKAQQPTPKPEDLPFPGSLTKRVPQDNYLAPLTALKEREQAYLASKQWGTFFWEIMAYTLADVGDYAGAIAYTDKLGEKSPLKELESSTLDDYQAKNALDVIASAAEKEQVIMINELHHVPMHRAFTTELLPVLYKKGFRYLAVEAVRKQDAELNRRGYPIYQTGTSEPVFGNLIRTALKLGFKVVPYEYDGDCKPPQDCRNERERGQAQNIYDRILRDDPQAKILVHAGIGHIQELEGKTVTIMAAHFKNISRIDPFTVDQIEMIEHSAPEYNFPDYNYAARKRLIDKPTIFQSAKGDYWLNKAGHFTTVNAQIFHPQAKYAKGRPTWLKTNGFRKETRIDTGKLNLPIRNKRFTGTEMFLVQAFSAEERAGAVPVDQTIIYPGKEIPALMLPKGSYRIQVIDKAGKVFGQYRKNIT